MYGGVVLCGVFLRFFIGVAFWAGPKRVIALAHRVKGFGHFLIVL
jgi:hypothetical protein